MRTLIAAVVVAVATWLLIPPWSSERAGVLGHEQRSANPSRWVWMRDRLRLGFGSAARRRAARERARTVQALGAFAAELESGQAPTSALLAAGGEPCVWPTAAAAVRLGEDIAGALTNDARVRPAVLPLAACWSVSVSTGTGFAAAVSRLASSARAAEAVRVDLEGELAGPRATARLLALLPVIGVGFGVMLGSDPLAWLLTTGPGVLCLISGAGLTALGAAWTARIAASVERLL